MGCIEEPYGSDPGRHKVWEQLKAEDGTLWQAYLLKESLREIFAGDLENEQVMTLIDQWCAAAASSGLEPFHKAAATIGEHRVGIAAGVSRNMSNGRHEGLNNKIRMIVRRAYGFHSPEATLAMIMLVCGSVEVRLPYHR